MKKRKNYPHAKISKFIVIMVLLFRGYIILIYGLSMLHIMNIHYTVQQIDVDGMSESQGGGAL